jgi:outer membrane protein TolC
MLHMPTPLFQTVIKKYHLMVVLCFIFSQNGFAQKNILTYPLFLDIVKNHHPASFQAEIQDNIGDAEVLSARGNFDPVASHVQYQKNFDNKRYYSITQSGIQIPTKIGLELHAGVEQTGGDFLNPERNLPDAGLAFAGITLPIAQNLLFDKRRAQLRLAKLYRDAQNFERDMILNELFYEAGYAYWDWFVSYNVMQTYKNALELAINRKSFIVQSARLGDLPFIDTTEATIQVQQVEANLLQSEVEFQNATLLLSTYLWVDGKTPLEINENITPPLIKEIEPKLPAIQQEQEVKAITRNHPKLQQARIDVEELMVARRLQRNLLLPKFDLKYNAIAEPIGGNPFSQFNSNNFVWGFQFSMPLLLRKERGDLKETNLKIQQIEWDTSILSYNIHIHALRQLNQWNTTYKQSTVFQLSLLDNERLLLAEEIKFKNGESTIFMINTRQIAYVTAEIKLAEILAKNRQFEIATLYAMGLNGFNP